VVDARTGAPLPRAHVSISRTSGGDPLASLATGDDGKFAFDLPEGKYSLIAGPRDLQLVFGMRGSDEGFGTSIVTGPGQNTAGLLFRWFPPSAISGRIVDQDGEPVRSALVQLLRSGVVGGLRRVTSVAWDRTNDLGEYRFGRIPAGSYYLAVTGRPWYSGTGSDGSAAAAYVPVYYPNATERAQAAPLVVAAGEEARADFNLVTTLGSSVTVKSEAQPGQQCVLGLTTEGIGGTEGFQEQANAAGTTAVIRAVPPGAYTVQLHCSGGGSSLWATRAIQVNGADLPVELSLRPAPTISGSIQLKNPSAVPHGSLLASLVREVGTGSVGVAAGPNGSFAFPSVALGRYRPRISGTDGYFASEIHLDGADYRDGVVELVEGETVTLRMVASDEIGRVRGFVVLGDQPVEGALVVLAAATGPAGPDSSHGFQTDSDGSFDFQHIPAGDYFLFAVEDLKLEYANPASIKPYLDGAKQIRVEPHGTNSERISLPAARN